MRFPGQYIDRETDSHYNHFRYYNPIVGRYNTSDPIGLDGGYNTYAYVYGNSISRYDPLGLDSYLVSRPLSVTTAANHNFIVTNATSLGDPNATIYSYGNIGDGTMGLVNNVNQGPSADTYETDVSYWQSMSSSETNATARPIFASDREVDSYASTVLSGELTYNYIPGLQGGVNSNSAAGAVAFMSDGRIPFVVNAVSQPGSGQHGRVQFGNMCR